MRHPLTRHGRPDRAILKALRLCCYGSEYVAAELTAEELAAMVAAEEAAQAAAAQKAAEAEKKFMEMLKGVAA